MSILKTIYLQHLNGANANMTLDSSGRVGIANTNPQYTLDVNGYVRVQSNQRLLFGNTEGGWLDDNFGNGDLLNITGKSSGLRFLKSDLSVEHMRIDSSGRVTRPYQPGCYVGKSDGAWTGTCIFNVTSGSKGFHNTGGHYNASNGRFTAPKSGRYFIAVDSMTQNNNSASHLYYYLSLNGTVAATAYGWSGTVNTHFPLSMCRMLYLNENEYVEVVGGTGAFYGSDSSYTTLAIYLVG